MSRDGVPGVVGVSGQCVALPRNGEEDAAGARVLNQDWSLVTRGQQAGFKDPRLMPWLGKQYRSAVGFRLLTRRASCERSGCV